MIGRWLAPGLGLVLLAATTATVATPARASTAGIEVISENVQNRFPDGVSFTLFVGSDAEISSVRLRYRILPDGVPVSARPRCTTGASINCTADVGVSQASYMVPGAEIVYSWEVEDAAGASLRTEEARFMYEDDRFTWESITEANLTVYFYFGDQDSQRLVLSTARETIDRLSALMATRVDLPVKIWVYRTAQEMQPAVASRRGQGPSSSVQTLGEVGASDTALISRDTDFLNIVRHELAHIVTRQATDDHITDIPVWINEGISTYAQRELLPSEARALDLAIRRDAVLPITSLSVSARGTADLVSLFYAQSGSLIAYLVETGGEAQFGRFIAALGRATADDAMLQVYGFDRLGLENGWRQSVGLAPVSGGGAAPREQAPLATLVPLGGGGQAPASETPATANEPAATDTRAAEDDGGASALVLIVTAVAGGIALAGGGLYALRRRSRRAA